jgi:hypothetical protein
MTVNAGCIHIVFGRVDARDALALTGGIRQQRVTTQTLLPVSDDDQGFRLFGMVKRRAVAVLAGNDSMKVLGTNIHDVAVALCTVFMHLLLPGVTILQWLVLPDFLIGLVVVAVHEAVFTGAKVVRNIKRPEQHDYGDNANDHIQWPPYMTFHNGVPLFPSRSVASKCCIKRLVQSLDVYVF